MNKEMDFFFENRNNEIFFFYRKKTEKYVEWVNKCKSVKLEKNDSLKKMLKSLKLYDKKQEFSINGLKIRSFENDRFSLLELNGDFENLGFISQKNYYQISNTKKLYILKIKKDLEHKTNKEF